MAIYMFINEEQSPAKKIFIMMLKCFIYNKLISMNN